LDLHHGAHALATEGNVIAMVFVALVFAVLTVASVFAISMAHPPSGHAGAHDHEGRRLSPRGTITKAILSSRWAHVFQHMAAMSFAWSLQYAGRWQIARILKQIGLPFTEHSTAEQVIVALTLMLVSFAFIFVLDYFEDLDATGEVADRCIRSISTALGILIGFSWEHSFESGVTVLSTELKVLASSNPATMRMVLSVAVSSVVIPAWRKHIVGKVHKLELEHYERNGMELTSQLAWLLESSHGKQQPGRHGTKVVRRMQAAVSPGHGPNDAPGGAQGSRAESRMFSREYTRLHP